MTAARKPTASKAPAGPMTFVRIGMLGELLLPDKEAHQLAALMRKAYECDAMYSARSKLYTQWRAPVVEMRSMDPADIVTGERAHDGSDQ